MTMHLTAFYAPLIPMGIFFSCIGLSGMYWMEKWRLFNNSSVQCNVGPELSIKKIKALEMTLVIFTMSNLFFQYMIIP